MSNQHIQQPGKGVLFMNDRKTSEKHPDWKGTLTLSDGTPVKIAGWTKQTPKGSLISLAEDTFKPANQQQYPREVNHTTDEDVPF